MLTKRKIEVTEAKCERCGYVWQVRVSLPKRCPDCKRPDWNRIKKQPKH